jgi:hypothetical protein
MRQHQPWGTRTMDSSEIQRFERILQIRLEETMRSLDRLGVETRSIDSDFPSDAAAFLLAPATVRWSRSVGSGRLQRSGDVPCFGQAEKR